MDAEERYRLSRALATRNAQPRERQDNQETENQNRNSELQIRRGRAGGDAQ